MDPKVPRKTVAFCIVFVGVTGLSSFQRTIQKEYNNIATVIAGLSMKKRISIIFFPEIYLLLGDRWVPKFQPTSTGQVGSANINDRSLLGNRDAELGVVTWAGQFPKTLRETLLRCLGLVYGIWRWHMISHHFGGGGVVIWAILGVLASWGMLGYKFGSVNCGYL